MKKIFVILFLSAFLFPACKKVIEPKLGDTGQIGSDEFYTDFNGALQGINGVYPAVQRVYRRLWITDMLSDDGETGSGGDQAWADVEYHSINAASGIIADLWGSNYNGIFRANTFLARAPKITGLTINQAILRNQFIGEAYFLRALFYFNLVRLHGDVPLLTDELTNLDQLNIPKIAAAQVYAQIEKDLLEAIKTLPPTFPNPRLIAPVVGISGGSELGRATLGSAKTLLGHLYLTLRENAKAEQMLLDVVNSNVYSLNANYANNFNALGGPKNSPESIFEAQFTALATLPGAQNDFGFQFGPTEGAVPNLARNRPTDNTMIESLDLVNTLVQQFPAADLRKEHTASYSTSTPIRSINKKYFTPTTNQGATNWVVYRYADAILMLAEALQSQGKDAAALIELNKVRANPRTGLTAYSGLTGTDLRDAIRLERRLELGLESKRWFDLLRWNTVESVMAAHKRPIQPGTRGLMPIPQEEIIKNPKLIQNNGY